MCGQFFHSDTYLHSPISKMSIKLIKFLHFDKMVLFNFDCVLTESEALAGIGNLAYFASPDDDPYFTTKGEVNKRLTSTVKPFQLKS